MCPSSPPFRTSARPLAALLVLATLGATVVACGGGSEDGRPSTPESRPNIVLIVADDQRLDGLAYMPHTQELLGAEGTTFTDAVVSYSNCCPSRATMQTGQYSHNHGVLDNLPPYGADSFDAANALPVWLQEAGYRTSHLGKWLNGYGEYQAPQPLEGWDDWFTFIDPTTYQAYGWQVLTSDGERITGEPGEHTVDAIAAEAERQVPELAASEDPYFLQIDFLGPHSMQGEGSISPGAPIPLPRHPDAPVELLQDLPALTESDPSDKPQAVRRAGLPARTDQELAFATLAQLTARSLLGVDEGIEGIVDAVEATGEMDDTIIVFTSDNGLLMGEHQLFGKVNPYEPAIRVPLIVRGGGFPAGVEVDAPVANVDLAPTLAALAGAEPSVPFDGRSLYPVAMAPPDEGEEQRAILLENGPTQPQAPHFEGIRVDGWTYVEWDTGELELYDREADPSQLESLHLSPDHAEVRAQLAEALDLLRGCEGEQCDVFLSVDRP